MSAPHPSPNTPEPAPGPVAAPAERRLEILRRLSEKALRMVEAVKEDGSAESAEAFAKLSRAIRLTLTLEAKFEAGVHEAAAKAAAAREADPFVSLRSGVKARALDLVREVIDREILDGDENDTIVDALEERLLCDEAYDHIEGLPMRDIVEHLCVDLELHPDWSRWTGEGWKPDPPFHRRLCSDFRVPSRTTILNDLDDPDPLE